MLQGFLNNSPAPEEQEDPSMSAPPSPSVNFDVQRNSQDMQMMTDAMMYAPMLRGMDHDQRKEKWPGMVKKLSEVNPKAGQMLDPSLPPDDKTLDSMLQRMPQADAPDSGAGQQAAYSRKDYMDAMVQRQMQGKEPISHADWAKQQEAEKKKVKKPSDDKIIEGAIDQAKGTPQQASLFSSKGEENTKNISSSLKKDLRKKLIDTEKDYDNLYDLYKNWDNDAFTYSGGLSEFIAKQKDKLNMASPEDQKLLASRIQQAQRIDRMMLVWRKYITGVAGGEKEMKRIEETTLNRDLSPAQARSARDLLLKKIIRDRVVYSSLLKDGHSLDSLGEKSYSKKFNDRRKKVETEFDNFISKFKKANPNSTDSDAIMYLQNRRRENPKYGK